MQKVKTKTSINIDEELWKRFSIRVIEKHGGRKKNDVTEELLEKYLKGEHHGKK